MIIELSSDKINSLKSKNELKDFINDSFKEQIEKEKIKEQQEK